MSKNNAPIQKIEIWPLKAAIWRNEGKNQDAGGRGAWFNVTVERTYKEGDEYKSSSSFGRDDLLPLAKILDQAHSAIVKLEKQQHQDNKGE
jgi:hypothetical protein